MKHTRLSLRFLALITITGLTGCGESPKPLPPAPLPVMATPSAPDTTLAGKPRWFYNPSPDANTLGGIGICGRHVRGPSSQRELAIKRCFDELATQMGTKVDTTIEKISNSSGTSGSIYSFQTVEGKVVKARLREQWIDPQTEELYIWMTVP